MADLQQLLADNIVQQRRGIERGDADPADHLSDWVTHVLDEPVHDRRYWSTYQEAMGHHIDRYRREYAIIFRALVDYVPAAMVRSIDIETQATEIAARCRCDRGGYLAVCSSGV
jgi:hypothetical protein